MQKKDFRFIFYFFDCPLLEPQHSRSSESGINFINHVVERKNAQICAYLCKFVQIYANLCKRTKLYICTEPEVISNVSLYALQLCFSTGGQRPIFGSWFPTFGTPKPVLQQYYCNTWKPNSALFCYVVRQLPNVQKLYSTYQKDQCKSIGAKATK